jgi:hypothetical protein
MTNHRCAARRAVLASAQSPGATRTAVGEQGDFGVSQDFDFADDTIPAPVFALTTAAAPQLVLPHAQRIGILQRLCWGVQRIRHVSMYARDTGFGGTSAHPSGDGFIVGKGFTGV